MRCNVQLVLLLLIGFCCPSCRTPRNPIATWTPGEGYEYLIVARRFSLGPVSFDARTSTGEFAFRAVLRGQNARQIFKLILSPGAQATEEGRLYALCGLRATDRAAFEEQATIMARNNPEVTTQSGCIVARGRAAEEIKRISEGAYDSYFAKR